MFLVSHFQAANDVFKNKHNSYFSDVMLALCNVFFRSSNAQKKYLMDFFSTKKNQLNMLQKLFIFVFSFNNFTLNKKNVLLPAYIFILCHYLVDMSS